eukprot:8768003-Karenia_brevis.AAC.1
MYVNAYPLSLGNGASSHFSSDSAKALAHWIWSYLINALPQDEGSLECHLGSAALDSGNYRCYRLSTKM